MAMKFRAHDTFFIRKGWLSKGMKYVCIKSDVFVAKDENPMDVLGKHGKSIEILAAGCRTYCRTEQRQKKSILHKAW